MENEEQPKRSAFDSCLVAVAFAFIIGIIFVVMFIFNIQQQLSMGA